MAPRQPSLFGEDPSATGSDHAIVSVGSRRTGPLSKKEKAFHRLLARVQSLEQRLVARKQQLDAALAFHAREVRPRQERTIALRKDLLRRLLPFLDDRRLGPAERRALGAIMADQLDEVLLFEELTDHDLCALFERLHGASYADAAQHEIDEAQSALAETLAEIGLDVEIPKLRLGMTDADIAATVAQMMEGVAQQAPAFIEKLRGPTKRASRGELAEERLRAFEEARKAGITALYRRLVKALHPDLEREPQARARKSALMQDVTGAYARNDFHALMRIELGWLDRESTAAAGLGDETLGVYIDLLKEQAAQLEDEYTALPFHPRYESLVADDGPGGFPMLIDGPAEVDRLEMVADTLRHGLDHVSSGDALTHVRGAIRDYRQAERRDRTERRPQRGRPTRQRRR